jgi:hypothetical protein
MSDTYLNSPPIFKRGQKDGIKGTITVLTRIIDGTDTGKNAVADRELEKIRRVLLMWRDYIVEDRVKNKKALEVLVETKKIMDIQIPESLK